MSDCNELYRQHKDWPPCVRSLKDVSKYQRELNFWRKGGSHRGIGELQDLTELAATAVNDEFFAEISQIRGLKRLHIDKLNVADLSPLCQLDSLEFLRIHGLSPAKNLVVLGSLPKVTSLFLAESYELTDYSFLSNAKRLVALGIEGSTWTKQKVDSLSPLSGLSRLEALFMASVQLEDKNLDYLAKNPELKYFWAARFAPKASFDSLRKLMPNLECQWCDDYGD